MSHPYRPVVAFLIKVSLLYFSWLLIYHSLLEPSGKTDQFFNRITVLSTCHLLNGIGYESYESGNNVWIKDTAAIEVNTPCNGLDLFMLFAILILAFPGPRRKKFWFVPAGVFLIFIANVMRVAGLVMILKYAPSSLEFNHKYTFTAIVYLIIFVFWMWWVNRVSLPFLKSKG